MEENNNGIDATKMSRAKYISTLFFRRSDVMMCTKDISSCAHCYVKKRNQIDAANAVLFCSLDA